MKRVCLRTESTRYTANNNSDPAHTNLEADFWYLNALQCIIGDLKKARFTEQLAADATKNDVFVWW